MKGSRLKKKRVGGGKHGSFEEQVVGACRGRRDGDILAVGGNKHDNI